ncbi:hypothetical protein QBC34DRAFT_496513 [Podospora aff. communis PSN243]|uniref:Heterokaryon incompatibility domain-containing protein n=1 Tax=Podospora aff. communis PSN243 TaxID=3040156 RepID=A0AAV9GFK2_9PEZI|nr:hypothetical protein QBC34DRAFT_496513 [Podospora aff. communis PSN243]
MDQPDELQLLNFDGHPALPAVRFGGCELCEWPLRKEDTYLSFVGNSSSTAYASLERCHTPQDVAKSNILCPYRSRCSTCGGAPEAICVHTGCFRLVMQHTQLAQQDLLDFMWVRAAWKAPWRDAPHLSLELSPPPAPPASPMSALGLSHFNKLPVELVQQIWQNSTASTLWGYARVLDIAHHANESAPSQATLVTVPFSRVVSWERGSQPVLSPTPRILAKAQGPPQTTRITIDSEGIRAIERFDYGALYDQRARRDRSDRLAFAFIDESDEFRVKVHFKYHLARLELSYSRERGSRTIWPPPLFDTPVPPPLEDLQVNLLGLAWSFLNDGLDNTWRFYTAELDKITGLTFLTSGHTLVAIHPHTPQEPSAASTVARLPPWVEPPKTWEYFTVSELRSERASDKRGYPWTSTYLDDGFPGLLGPRDQPAHLLIWGSYLAAQDQVCVMATSVVTQGQEIIPPGDIYMRISDDGAYIDRVRSDDGVYIDRVRPDGGMGAPRFYEASASLADVAWIEVFNDMDGYTEGILVVYKDGATQIGVGSCRVGVEDGVVTSEPERMLVLDEPERRERPEYQWGGARRRRYKVAFLAKGCSFVLREGEIQRGIKDEESALVFEAESIEEGLIATAVTIFNKR